MIRLESTKIEFGDAWADSVYVFIDAARLPLDLNLMTRAFKKVVKEVGMPHLTPHGLRYQYATAAREAGGIISKDMGHASVAITEDIYPHLPAVLWNGCF